MHAPESSFESAMAGRLIAVARAKVAEYKSWEMGLLVTEVAFFSLGFICGLRFCTSKHLRNQVTFFRGFSEGRRIEIELGVNNRLFDLTQRS